MFCQTGRIVDSFIPVNKSIGLGRGSPLVRFGAMEEVERAIANVNGRSWGGGGGRRKIQVNLARHVSTKVNAPFSAAQTTKVMSAIIPERGAGMGTSSSQGQRSFVEAVSSNLHEEAWPLKRVRMAPWALEEGKKKLHRGLVGFLRSSTEGLHAADNCWVEFVGSCRVKVLLGGSVKLPTRLTLCFGDLFTSVLVEEEFVQVDLGDSNLADDGSFEEDDDDVMLTGKNSKFDIPSSADEFDLMFQVDDALSDRDDFKWDLQIIPSSIQSPIISSRFVTPSTSSAHIVRQSRSVTR
ncbi:hypothetical protein MRB53_016257 [Persea americana]|uniref:Uncharacterized protein n=1 Tax=Persea americana TaxID=3435 RepID=A0ACC2M1M5_PERAE|nr:hypothetical protein MRB53_016257 [Persea americana]